MLRVIAGELGGRRLRTPPGRTTRPTADRVREALFNILGPPPEGALVLDLYAGSGALGIESLSRGARHATFVEQDAQVCRTIAVNLRELGLLARATVLCRPVRAALGQLAGGRSPMGPFHWIFADPPYASSGTTGELPWLLDLLGASPLLGPDGCFIVERASRDADEMAAALASVPGLELHDRRRYGDTALLFVTAKNGEAS